MDTAAILSLIGSLYGQLIDAKRRIDELENELRRREPPNVTDAAN